LGLWRLTAHKISEIFGIRLTSRFRDELANVVEQVGQGHHIFRAYCKNAFVKQYEEFAVFLRNEVCSNNLSDFRLKRGLDPLYAVRKRFQILTERFAALQAQWLNVHVDFPLLQRIALPAKIGSVHYPGLKIHDVRLIRVFEELLHNGNLLGGWTSRQIHQVVPTSFRLSENLYSLNQLRYDLRRPQGHELLQRDALSTPV